MLIALPWSQPIMAIRPFVQIREVNLQFGTPKPVVLVWVPIKQVFKRNLVLRLSISACVGASGWVFKWRHANNSTTN
jgi:hypothetical protein